MRKLLLLSFSIGSFTAGAQTYCTPLTTNGCSSGDDINTLTLAACGGFSQLNTGCSTGAYIYYNSLAAFSAPQGVTLNGTVNTSYSGGAVLRIWIDFNDDGTFAASEEVGNASTVATTPATTSYTVTIPAGAALGVHRMRYRTRRTGTVASIDPCTNIANGETQDYNITIISATPTAPIVTNNGPVCANTPLTITATDAYCNGTFTLTGPGGTGGAAVTISNTTGTFTLSNPTTANAGTYSVTYTVNGSTSTATTTTVSIYPVPTIALGTITTPSACATATGAIQITGLAPSTPYTFYYRKPPVQQTPIVGTSTAGGTYTITGLSQGTYDSIRVKTTNGCYSNLLGPVTISDPNPPAAPTLTYTTVCSNDTLFLTAGSSGAAYPAGTVYTFSGPGGFTATGTSNIGKKPNFSAADNGNYSVYVMVGSCTSSTTTTAVTLTAASAAPTVTNPSYCQGEFALPIVNSVTGNNIKVYTALTGGSPLPANYVPSTGTAGPQTFYVTQSNPCPNIPRAALTVTVKPRPLAPVSTSPTSLCQYEVAQPLTAQGTSLLWYTTATGGTGSTTAPTPATLTPGTYNFYVSQTVNGCEGPRTIITVTVKPKPAPPTVNSPLQLCQNDPPSPLTAQGQGLRWYTTATGGVGVTTAPVPNVGYEDSFFYYVSQTVNGCESDRARLKVVVNYRPNGIILATRPWVCAEDTVSFVYFGNGRTDAIYNWHTPHPQTDIISGDHTQGPLLVSFNTAGTQTVTLQVNNHGCLSPVLTAAVSVRPLPTATFVHSKDDICTDQVVNVALSQISGNISDYNWTGFDGATVAYGTYNGGPFGLSWSQPGQHVITLVVTSNECDSHAITDTVTVHAYPDAKIHYTGTDPINVCASDSVELSVMVGSDPATYAWTPAAYFYGRSDSSATVYAQPKYSGKVGVMVTSIYGCAAKDSIDITTKPCCGVTFPTAFAPSGNVIQNRRFRPVTVGHHEVTSFRVINRWGVVVYESRDERQGWDGTYNGQLQDMGQFYYYFRYKCVDGQDLEEKGEVLLMR